jgi:hypothetical protein
MHHSISRCTALNFVIQPLDFNSTLETQIKNAFRKAAFEMHPDRAKVNVRARYTECPFALFQEGKWGFMYKDFVFYVQRHRLGS